MNIEKAREIVANDYRKDGWEIINNLDDYDIVVERGDEKLNIFVRYSVLFKPTPHWESDLFKLTSWSMVYANAFNFNMDPCDRVVFLLYHNITVEEKT